MKRQVSDIVAAWRHHCASFKTLNLRDGAVIQHQGKPYIHVYCVGSGYIKRLAVDKHGNGFIRALLSRGDFFGALTDAADQPASDSAVCKGAVRLHRCRSHEYYALIDSHPGVAHALLANLDSQLTFAQRQTDAILHSSVEIRVAQMLHGLAGRHGRMCRHGHELDIRLTQQELAELVGASRPVVSTVVNDLRRRGIVSYTRTFLCIESMEALQQLLTQ